MSTNKTYSEVIDEIRNRLDILDVVQSRVVLKKKGANSCIISICVIQDPIKAHTLPTF